jgi:glutaredoxin
MKVVKVVNPVKIMKLVQLSTTHCPPCNMLKGMIKKKYEAHLDNYQYIDLYDDITKEVSDILKQVSVKTVPRFVVMDGEKMVDDFGDPNEVGIKNITIKVDDFFSSL